MINTAEIHCDGENLVMIILTSYGYYEAKIRYLHGDKF